MLQHLELLFGRALEGRIEITGLDDAAKPRTRPRFFPVDSLDAAVDYAVEVNREPGRNVYVGAALRRDDVFPASCADDQDFLKTYAVWADADDDIQVASARAAYHALNVTPTFVVVTGRVPTKRAQLWWPLETPIDDIDTLRATLRGIAAVLKTDPKVCTGKQLMRLAGTVAWPKKDGRILERTEVVRPSRAAREFTLEQMQRAFPPLARAEAAASSIADVEVTPGGALGLEEVVTDGREGYAFRLVRAHLHEWIGTTGSDPTPDELYRSVAPVYLKKADQVRPGRGPEFLKQKCVEAVRAFHAGQIPFMRDLEEAVLSYAERQSHAAPEEDLDPNASRGNVNGEDLFQVLSIADIKQLPDADWLVHEAVPRGGLGFVYGAPGSYKSFVCYDLALALAHGHATWMDRALKGGGSVLYVASEGATGVKNRITAWQRAQGVEIDSAAFRLIRQSMSFMDPSDVDRLERTVAAVVEAGGPVDVVFVDTVSRVLPGADENLQKDMTIFVAACDRLRERFGATVIGVHHTNKNGDIRGSTVFVGQGDFVFRVDKDGETKGGVLTCEKQKEAEDGWKAAFSMETQSWMPEGRLVEASSLTVKWTGQPDAAPKVKWPARDKLRAFQRDIAAAFLEGEPLSLAPQTKLAGRYAPTRLSAAHEVSADLVLQVLETWLSNQVVKVQEVSSHAKLKGLNVLKWLE